METQERIQTYQRGPVDSRVRRLHQQHVNERGARRARAVLERIAAND